TRFGTPTEPQILGWPEIFAARDVLISAPTGSGKTLAAFLICVDRLVRAARARPLANQTAVVYVSPLKALSNDVHKNLEIPLAEISELASRRGIPLSPIRVALRTGDTPASERQHMGKERPHILVTTPESLYILVTAGKSREILRTVETVIVDEIHAVADDKRGAHLALSLERLAALADKPFVRIGLSATQKPIELVAHFLAGHGRPDPAIVQIGHRRTMDLAIEVPSSELGPITSHEMWDEVYERLAALVREHRSTLIFVNTRRLAERLAHHLEEKLGKDAVATHHGSLSRRLRLEAENKLKAGEVRALVATASLELGIDIGTVDLVCQIGSPRSIAVALQRVGRAGHWRGAIPKGRIFASTRDELIECAALVRAIRHGDLDRLEIPDSPMDVLAQQIVAMCSAEDFTEDELFALVRRAYPYRNLQREQFDELLAMLADGIAAQRGRYGAYLHRDRINGRVRGRRGARLAAITNGGAIPDNALYTVVAQPEGAVVGTVDEDFAVESLSGDIMLLGNTSWKIRRVQSGQVLVEDAQGAPPNVPFWRGEAPARTRELSEQVAELRARVDELALAVPPGVPVRNVPEAKEALEWLKRECAVDDAGAEQIVEHIAAGRAVLGAVPTQTTIIAERFFDEGGGMQLVIHAPLGGRINRAWGLALRKRFCRSFNFELQAAATDDGVNIALAEQHSFPLADVFHFLHPNSVGAVLEQAVLASPIFGTRWRWDASRALVLQRFQGGKKVPLPIQRIRSDDLLASVFPDAAACQENIQGDMQIPDHPLVREVMKDALTEAMDLDGLKELLGKILDGSIRCLAVDTPVPSQFSHEILNANPYAYLDDAPLEERRARAVEMRRVLPEAVLSEVGRLDPAAIAEVREEVWLDVRDSDELHDGLLTLIALPESPEVEIWRTYFDELAAGGRALRALCDGRTYWVAAEKAKSFLQIFPSARFEPTPLEIERQTPSREDVLFAAVMGWMQHSGPTRVSELARRLGIAVADTDGAMLRLEAKGTVLRGQFTSAVTGETEWCERRVLARIHRLTLGKLRREIQPVSPAQFMNWLLGWQHLVPGTQLLGERGTLEALRQLQGYEAPANAWERQILARRIANYDPDVLDRLCLTGAVGWGRLSPHPALLTDSKSPGHRVMPTSVAPITFFVRDEAEWMVSRRLAPEEDRAKGLSPAARDVLAFLNQRGASFFADIVRGTQKLKSEVESSLWELVAGGIITADGFDNLRALIDPKRRSGQGHGRATRPRHSTGRWSLLYAGGEENSTDSLEATCRLLLDRYGVVFREVLTRESILPRWREVFMALRRLEDRGEVRGGRFVEGFLGEQFALPAAVESLRAARSRGTTGETVTLSAADPLNLSGILVPGERVPALSGRQVAFRDGVAVEAPDHAVLSLPRTSLASDSARR
ncbi:MAG TPA: DEAD/DEAH box helicase, partial [Candidatus Acidoferrum sp.]|nr:DEAD/DEAH box helicase [Candidatus Acidoferrum sp.]